METGCRSRLVASLFAAAVAAGAVGDSHALGQGFSVISNPIQVPLHWRHIDGSTANPRKLGIYVTLGGAATPQLFEFDTGGDGFYATFSGSAAWWGGGWAATSGTFNQTYDSGMTYTGTAVTTAVSLFADASGGAPLVTATNVVVGQTVGIEKKRNDGSIEQLWPLPSGTSPPPVEQAFYGDFGMAPKRGQAGIDSLAGQLLYGPGVTAGFRIHASDESPWVQFGLTASDTAVRPTTFAMNLASGSSPAGVAYYENLVVTGSLFVVKDGQPFEQPTGLIFDTGASTTVHNSGSTSPFPPHLTQDHAEREVVHGATFVVSGSSLVSDAGWLPLMSLTTGGHVDVDQVAVQFKADNPNYYLNTGILPFMQNDFVYDLAAARLTTIAVPEPSAMLATAGAAGLAWLRWGRRKRRRAEGRRIPV